MKTNIKSYLEETNRTLREKQTMVDISAIKAMGKCLNNMGNEFALETPVPAILNNEVVGITDVVNKKDGRVWYIYVSGDKEKVDSAPALRFNARHSEVFDELACTYNNIHKGE